MLAGMLGSAAVTLTLWVGAPAASSIPPEIAATCRSDADNQAWKLAQTPRTPFFLETQKCTGPCKAHMSVELD